MQDLVDLIQAVSSGCLRFSLSKLIVAHEDWLEQFQIPIAELVPDKTICRACRFIEAIVRNAFRDSARRLGQFRQNPAIDSKLCIIRLEVWIKLHAVHLSKTCRIPKLRTEIAIASNTRRVELNIAALCGHDGKREAQSIRAILVHQLKRIDDIAFGFRHLRAVLVAHECMEINRMERNFFHEMHTHHHHAGNPEEQNVETRYQNTRRIIDAKFRRLVRPAQR